ncbi:MAG: hypothetical protein AB7D40_08105 [Bacteroidales bacterium]
MKPTNSNPCTKLVLLMFLCYFLQIKAQSWDIEMDYRPRIEYHDSKDLFKTSQRSRMRIGYQSERWTASLHLQESRTVEQSKFNQTSETFGFYERWFRYELMDHISIKIGRQTLALDDGRLFAAPDWSVYGTAHELALLTYNQSSIQMQVASTIDETDMQLIRGSIACNKRTKAALMLVRKSRSDTLVFTYGGHATHQNPTGNLRLSASVYVQTIYDAHEKPLRAHLFATKGTYECWKFAQLSVGIDVYQPGFQKLYGAEHSFNGYMDLWKKLPAGGLRDCYVGVGAGSRRESALRFEVAFHRFETIQKQTLGSELDLTGTYTIRNIGAMNMGCGILLGKTYWTFIQLRIHPQLKR